MNKNDLRYIKTENIIIENFLELIDEVGFENIYISELCRRAMINRKTFYLHYADKYALLEKIYGNLRDRMLGSLTDDVLMKIKNSDMYESVKWCVSQTDRNKELIRILLKGSRREFQEILKEIFSLYPSRQIILNYDEICSKTKHKIILIYMTDAMIGFFEVWLNNYSDLTLEEAIDMMFELVNQPASIYINNLLNDEDAVLVEEK